MIKNPNGFLWTMGKTFTGFFTFFLLLTSVHWFKKRGQFIQSTNIKYKLSESGNYLHDHYYSISKTKTYTKWTKRPINTHRVSQKKKNLKKLVIQVITIEQAPGNVLLTKKVFPENFVKIARKYLCWILLKFQTCSATGIFLSILQNF